MTTFTLQDLTPAQLVTDHLNAPEVPRETKEVLREILQTQHAPEPQPTCGQPVHTPTLTDIVNNICTQLQLLTTIINQPKAQPEGAQESLHETVGLVLQQADWFKDAIRIEMAGLDLESIAEGAVQNIVESEVASYFSNEFDPTYHFDFNDAVCSEVSDQLDDVVRDRLDEVVQEQLEEVVAEKLKSIRVVFD
jgi:hypothetical protein